MTIRTRIYDGNRINTRTYRKVYISKNFVEFKEGFLYQHDLNPWGVMWQLRGLERVMLATFGTVPVEERTYNE